MVERKSSSCAARDTGRTEARNSQRSERTTCQHPADRSAPLTESQAHLLAYLGLGISRVRFPLMRFSILECFPSRLPSRLSGRSSFDTIHISYAKRGISSRSTPAPQPPRQVPSVKAPKPAASQPPPSGSRRKKSASKRAPAPPNMDNFFFQNLPMPPMPPAGFPGQVPPPQPIPGFPTLPFNPFAPFPDVGSSMPFPLPQSFQQQPQQQQQAQPQGKGSVNPYP